jgi:hypothetical protein
MVLVCHVGIGATPTYATLVVVAYVVRVQNPDLIGTRWPAEIILVTPALLLIYAQVQHCAYWKRRLL